MSSDPSLNPYAAPQFGGADAAAPPEAIPDAERIRREHLSYETNLKSIGTLYILGAIILAVSGIGTMISVLGAVGDDQSFILIFAMLASFFAAVAGIFTYVGIGLQRLNPRIRIPAVVLSTITVFYLGLGTIIGIAALYLLFSKKGKFVFTPEYKEIIRQTPHVRLRTSWMTITLLVILVIVVLVLVFAFRV